MRQHTWMISLSVLFLMDHTYANPTGDVVSAGAATIATNGSTLTVAQSTPRAIIDWKSFNIGANETVQFNQPNSASIALNRVDPVAGISHIQGQLQSNGQLVLINQAGIAFGKGSIVNVGGIMASTADISNAHFLNSQYQFDQSDSAYPEWGHITNQGTITAADHGLVALMGSTISNSGTITAHLGHVALASGSQFTVDFLQDGLVNFTINQSLNKTLQGGIENTPDGTIMADGGTVLLTADLAKNTVDQAINMNGLIEANSVEQHNGTITLLGGDTGTVNVQGKITATGLQTNQTGGTVNITGNTVNIQKTAEITTNGDNGGGDINIGANPHNTGPLPTTDTLLVETDATISANAITNGNGGNITFWGEKSIIGQDGLHIASKGGAESGDGGQIESSGHGIFEVRGFSKSNRRALHGKAGTWLLDPYDLTISNNLNSYVAQSNQSLKPTADDANLKVSDLLTALKNGPVTVETTTTNEGTQSGNINIAPDIDDFTSWDNTLTLNAYRNITIGENTSIGDSTKNGSLTLTAGAIIQDASNATSSIKLGTGSLMLSEEEKQSSHLYGLIEADTITCLLGTIIMDRPRTTNIYVTSSNISPGLLDLSSATGIQNYNITLDSSLGFSTQINLSTAANDWSSFTVLGSNNTLFAPDNLTISHNIEGPGQLTLAASDNKNITLSNMQIGDTSPLNSLTVQAPLTFDTSSSDIRINTQGAQSYRKDIIFASTTEERNVNLTSFGDGIFTVRSYLIGDPNVNLTLTGNYSSLPFTMDSSHPLRSLDIHGEMKLDATNDIEIDTVYDQTYNNNIHLTGASNKNIILKGRHIAFSDILNNSFSNKNTLDITANSIIFNKAFDTPLVALHGLGGNNTLSLLVAGSGTQNTWTIDPGQQGSIASSWGHITSFENFQHLVGGSEQDTFTFQNGATLSSISAHGNLGTMDFNNYTTPITAQLSSLSKNGLASGALTTSSGDVIGTFSGINTANGSSLGGGTLYTPPGKSVSITYTSPTVGYINDPFNFNNFSVVNLSPSSHISPGSLFYYPPPIQGTNNPLLAMYNPFNLIDPILAEEVRWDQMMDVVVGCV